MGFIFEQEIDRIMNTVRARTIGEEESITLRHLLAAPIHPALKAYFRAEVEAALEEERAHESRSKRFPYAHPEIASLQRQIDLLLVQHYQFTQDEFMRVADEAVHFQFNYLCRPQWTLVNYIVGERRRVPVADIGRKLDRCVDYRYFPELIRTYCDDKGLAEMTFEEFRALVTRIDTEVVVRHSATELAAMTRSLLSFVDHGMASPHDVHNQPTLPTNAAIVFYEDKGLDEVKRRLEFERDKNGRLVLTLAELTAILNEVWELKDADRPAVVPPSVEPAPEPPMREEETAAPQERPKPEAGPAEFTATKVMEAVDLPNLHDLFTAAAGKRFIRSIFHKDEMLFREAMDALNACPTWEEASQALDKMFVAQNVDPFAKPAVEFTDLVFARYAPLRGGS